MDQQSDILEYYDDLAKDYDQNRFGNSYGKYLDHQERTVLSHWLEGISKTEIADIGCGTGRLLNFANTGMDISPQMLKVAQTKYPDCKLIEGKITDLPFKENEFTAMFSMHVFMHLDLQTIENGLREVKRVLIKDGVFIFDFPNKSRRKAINYQKSGWHGNTALDLPFLTKLLGTDWTIEHTTGFLLFPIHRFPKSVRRFIRPIDSWLCKTFLKHYASYYCVMIRRAN